MPQIASGTPHLRRALATLGLVLLLLTGCGGTAPPPADSGSDALADARQGFQDNALDRFFREKLGDPTLCQAAINSRQAQYDRAWGLIYRGLVNAMVSAAGDSAFGAETAVGFYAETDLSWESASAALRASWWAFREDAWGNAGTRCACITGYISGTGAPCWRTGRM